MSPLNRLVEMLRASLCCCCRWGTKPAVWVRQLWSHRPKRRVRRTGFVSLHGPEGLEALLLPGATLSPASGIGPTLSSVLNGSDGSSALLSSPALQNGSSSRSGLGDDPGSSDAASDLSVVNILASAANTVEAGIQQQGQNTAAQDAFFSNPQLMQAWQPWSIPSDDGLPSSAPQSQQPPFGLSQLPPFSPPGQGAAGGSGVPSGSQPASVNADPTQGAVSPSTTSSSNQTPLNQAAGMGMAQPMSSPSGNLSAGTQQAVHTTESATGSLSGPLVTFSDADGNTNPSKYTVSVNFGNGVQAPVIVNYSNGVFSVNAEGSPYTEEGTYNIVATVTDSDGDSLQINNTAQVADAALTGYSGGSLSGTAGQSTSGQLGSFTDANTASSTSDYSVSINWGDNSASTGGTLSGSNGSYGLAGSHVYNQAGSFHPVFPR